MKKLMGLTLVGLLLAPLVFSATTHADYLGGKFPHTPGSTTYLSYNYWGTADRYNGNVWQGAKNWRDAATRVKPTESTSNIKITIDDIYTSASYYGQAWMNPGPAGPTYSAAGFYLNQRLMDPLNDFDRTFVATHEFGHTLGLAHTSSTSVYSIMQPGGSGFPWFNTPMPYDQGQINSLYN